MAGYIVRRFLQSLGFILLATFVAYTVLVVLFPNSPARAYEDCKRLFAEEDPYPESVTGCRVLIDLYNVDEPWPLSYFAWLFDPGETTELNEISEVVPKGLDFKVGDIHLTGSGVLTGDFGKFDPRRSGGGELITSMIARGWPNTLLLLVMSLVLSIVIAIPLGIMGAARQNSRLDHALTFFQSVGLSLPAFGLGLLLIIALALLPKQWGSQLGWNWIPYLPPGSPYGIDQQDNFLNRVYHATLPALTLAIPQVALLSRYIRSSMLEVLRQDYIRTARAKGLPTWRVLAKHAFRNALIPLITTVALIIPALASGAIIVEQLFAYNGMGYLMFRALGGCVPTQDRACPPGGGFTDTSLLLPLLLILITVIAISNMIADILYAMADPRIDYAGKATG